MYIEFIWEDFSHPDLWVFSWDMMFYFSHPDLWVF